MKQLKGLYIEDEKDNIATYSRLFKLAGIEIISCEIHDAPEKYYDIICELDVDFVIIDNHLDKVGVPYNGFDILKEIRKEDSSIYILLLTNYDYEDETGLGEFDQTIKKEFFIEKYKDIIDRVKRAYERKSNQEITEQINTKIDLERNKSEKEISMLEEINKKLDNILSQNKPK